MDAIMEKTSDRSRSLLFGLLLSCLLSDETMSDCPLAHLRGSLSLEEKYDFVMRLHQEEVETLVELHSHCFAKKISALRCFDEMNNARSMQLGAD